MRCRVVRASRGKCREVYLTLRCRDGGKRVVRVAGFAPYFYVPSRLGTYRSVFGETLDRVEAPCPEDVPRLREQYERHYEADIPYARRFLIDSGILDGVEYPGGFEAKYTELKPAHALDIPLKIFYIDIEVEAPVMPSPAEPEHPVVAITVYDGKVYRTFYWHSSVKSSKVLRGRKSIRACGMERERVEWEVRAFPSEEEMLLDFLSYIASESPDYVAGWNVGFDVGYLAGRMQALGMELPFDFVPLDMLEGFRRIGPRQRSYRLKEVTVSEGVECKEDALEASDVLRSWKEDPKPLLLYNLRDVWRIVKIDEVYRVVDYFIAIRDVVGIESISRVDRSKPWDVALLTPLPLIESMVLREARRRGVALPSGVRDRGRKRAIVRGAIVLDPVPGIHEGVAVLDMSRYYPSLIISFNISPELKARLLDPANGIWEFRQEPEGLLPATVRIILELREKLEQELQNYEPDSHEYRVIESKIMALKGLANSFYGVTANPAFRLYDPDVANTITGLAREGISFVVRRAEQLGYRVLYGDTDSIFVKVDFESAGELAERLTQELREYFVDKYGLRREPVLKLKFEKYYSRIFFKPRTKKRYAGLLVWKKGKRVDPPQLDVAGFEAVRTDAAPFTAHAQMELFKVILSGGGREEVVRALSKLEREARGRPLSDIALFEGLTKSPGEYRVKQPHVRAALYANLYLGASFGAGSKVRYIYVKRVKCPGLPPTDVVGFDSDLEERVAECFEVDWEKQLDAVLYSPLRDILEALDIHVSKGVKLHDFF